MLRDDAISHLSLSTATAVYAVYLESLDSSYHPNGTIFTVMGGVALTGAGVALRLALGVPGGPPRWVAWWVWRQVFYHFCTSGAVIGAWQLWQAAELRREQEDARRGTTRAGRGGGA